MKTIGIVVPIYNAELYLEQCINSILKQTYKNLELVLVNDGSTDGSGQICDKYAALDKRVRVIHQENKGKLFARYLGVKTLESDYATFVDADDWIEVDAYEKVAKYLDEDIDMISFKIIRYFDDTYQYVSPNNYASGLYKGKEIIDKIYPTMIWDKGKKTFGLDPSLCNKVVKRSLLLAELYRTNNLQISYGDDVAVTYVMVTHINSLVITEECLYYHRQRDRGKVADYLVDKDYYKKLFFLYEYLLKSFYDDIEIVRQIDYFYSTSVQYHLQVYGDKSAGRNILFPFDKVAVNKRIILYGASTVGQTYYQQFSQINYGTIIAWVDQNYDAYKSLGVKSIDVIKERQDYDYVVIAVINEETASSIKNTLKKMKVDESKIVWSIK